MYKKEKMNLRFGVIAIMILMAAASRILPHPPNFSPVGAMALFGGAYFLRPAMAFLVPLLSLWLSDLVINNVIYGQYQTGFVWLYDGFYWIYGSFALIVLLGMFLLKKIKTKNIAIAAFSSSVLFFLISNFSVWLGSSMYSQNINGLIACYTFALPYFGNTLFGDLFYTGVMFGLFEFVKNRVPALQTS